MSRDLTKVLARWFGAGFEQIGQVAISRRPDGSFELRNIDDASRKELALFTRSEDARLLASLDDAGRYRPLKTAPNLRHGWQLVLSDVAALRRALDYFYPAMLGVLLSHERRELQPVALRETLARQSGMYAVTKKISEEQAQSMIAGFCTSSGGCLKTILWRISPQVPVASLPARKFDVSANQLDMPTRAFPMLCHEACNLLVAKAREVVKRSATPA